MIPESKRIGFCLCWFKTIACESLTVYLWCGWNVIFERLWWIHTTNRGIYRVANPSKQCPRCTSLWLSQGWAERCVNAINSRFPRIYHLIDSIKISSTRHSSIRPTSKYSRGFIPTVSRLSPKFNGWRGIFFVCLNKSNFFLFAFCVWIVTLSRWFPDFSFVCPFTRALITDYTAHWHFP